MPGPSGTVEPGPGMALRWAPGAGGQGHHQEEGGEETCMREVQEAEAGGSGAQEECRQDSGPRGEQEVWHPDVREGRAELQEACLGRARGTSGGRGTGNQRLHAKYLKLANHVENSMKRIKTVHLGNRRAVARPRDDAGRRQRREIPSRRSCWGVYIFTESALCNCLGLCNIMRYVCFWKIFKSKIVFQYEKHFLLN